MERLAQTIGARIKTERKKHDWTLDQLDELVGASRRMVFNIEQGTARSRVSLPSGLGQFLGVLALVLLESR